MDEKTKNADNFYKQGVHYTFSISPMDKYQYFGHPKRFKQWYAFMYEQLFRLNAQYDMSIELSEPRGTLQQGTQGSRLHTHGIIYWKNNDQIIKFLLNDMRKLLQFARIEIDTINDATYWEHYCHKTLIFKKRLKNENIFPRSGGA